MAALAALTRASAACAQLLSHLRALSDNVLTRLREAEEQARLFPPGSGGAAAALMCTRTRVRLPCFAAQLEALEHDAALGDVAVAAETLRFNALSNTQFVENVRPCAASCVASFRP